MSDQPAVFAIAAHPDDIEFMMAGTLLQLRDAGWRLHYLNIANGSCGTATEPADVIIAKRREEAQAACRLIGAEYCESLCNDIEVYHTTATVARVVAMIRRARPRIVLTGSPQDYMEDHINACRIAVTAAFCRGMLNGPCDPPTDPVPDGVTVYHALPHGLCGPLRDRIHPGQFVDVTAVMKEKRDMLACHRSQKEWLDRSQGMDSYLDTMVEFSGKVGALSTRFEYAEGWRRHLHFGFSETDSDPLTAALGDRCRVDPDYEASLA